MNLAKMNVQSDACREAAKQLLRAFVWSGSPQGQASWAAVYSALEQIAEAAEQEDA
jgi:hypothetical protein